MMCVTLPFVDLKPAGETGEKWSIHFPPTVFQRLEPFDPVVDFSLKRPVGTDGDWNLPRTCHVKSI